VDTRAAAASGGTEIDMIPPHELKNKTFQRVVRGYNVTEVDEYFEFLIDKYTELYRENAELEKQIKVMTAKYDDLANDEQSIRAAIVKAQKLSEKIIESANREASALLSSANEKCAAIVEEAKRKVGEERKKILVIGDVASEFKDRLYDQYIEHIKLLKDMDITVPENIDEHMITDAQIKKKILGDTGAETEEKPQERSAEKSSAASEKPEESAGEKTADSAES